MATSGITVPDEANEAARVQERDDGTVRTRISFEIWRGSCLEALCGPHPSLEEQQKWYRWCQYHCTEHGVCKRKDPPGSF